MSDPRFARLKSDPRFRKPRRAKNKVVVDSRFKSLLGEEDDGNGNKATQKARVDKYGRKISKSKDKDNLRRFYRLDEGEESSSKPPAPAIDYARGEVLMESSSEEEASGESDESDTEEVAIGRQVSQPSTSKGKKANELLDIDLDESTFADLDAQAKAYTSNTQEDEGDEETAEPTTRLAAVNLDWDHVTAAHLFPRYYLCAASWRQVKGLASGGIPQTLQKGRGARADEVDSDEEVNAETIFTAQNGEDDYDDDALRQYQLDRLRYYYAIITCDSPSTASHIYNELHGTELERSANIFDFSYVPEDMEFTQESRDECTSEAQASTKGMDFVTDALRHSKVKLTWDDDDPERNKITRRRMTRKEGKRQDRETLRGLLLGGDNDDLPEGWGDDGGNNKSGDLEITFMPALSSKTPIDEEEETTLDRYKRKQKEKRQQKKSKRDADPTLAKDDGESGDDFFGNDGEDEVVPPPAKPGNKPKGSNLSDSTQEDRKVRESKSVGKKSRRRDKKGANMNEVEDGRDFHIDVKDERFAALHEDHAFAIDPSNPHFQNTKAMKALLDERAKRQREQQSKEEAQAREKIKAVRENDSDDRSLKSIVESVKRKSSIARRVLASDRNCDSSSTGQKNSRRVELAVVVTLLTMKTDSKSLFGNLRGDLHAAALEFVGTILFLLLGLGGIQAAAYSNQASVAAAAITLKVMELISMGLSLLVSVWFFYRVTGGVFNPAVATSLLLIGAIGPVRWVLYCLAQLIGGIVASALLLALLPGELVVTPSPAQGVNAAQAVFIEAFLTSALVLAVLMLAAEKHRSTPFAPVDWYRPYSLCMPPLGVVYTGAAMNTARAFGPAVVSGFDKDHWVYWLGPFIGSLMATLFYGFLKHIKYWKLNPDQDVADPKMSPPDPLGNMLSRSRTDDDTNVAPANTNGYAMNGTNGHAVNGVNGNHKTKSNI
ncbi:NUC153 protein [Rhizoctonia solani]|uniref:NUC153 protein n=1 Tax=Rhizoctonia solani TaxID=456999 RepID=A0A8H7INY6_9AGAM|nr:NUC153 protein [Rhizoctonia solani]